MARFHFDDAARRQASAHRGPSKMCYEQHEGSGEDAAAGHLSCRSFAARGGYFHPATAGGARRREDRLNAAALVQAVGYDHDPYHDARAPSAPIWGMAGA